MYLHYIIGVINSSIKNKFYAVINLDLFLPFIFFIHNSLTHNFILLIVFY